MSFKGDSMWVVKIGGSLLGSPELERWLDIFVKFSDGKIVIVPGGGVFADAVRDAQKLCNIDDSSAHKLALLAMDQFGHLLYSLNPKLATASTELELDERTWQHRAIVWLPSRMVLSDDMIPQNWDVTSDSIAAWLAEKLCATHLILLKSDKPEESNLCLKAITNNGLVDFEFQNFIRDKEFSTWMVHKSDFEHFEDGTSKMMLEKIASAVN